MSPVATPTAVAYLIAAVVQLLDVENVAFANPVALPGVTADHLEAAPLVVLSALLGRKPRPQQHLRALIGCPTFVGFSQECLRHWVGVASRPDSPANQPRYEQRLLGGRIEGLHNAAVALADTGRSRKAEAGQLFKPPFRFLELLGVVWIKLVSRVSVVVHHDLNGHDCILP
jgi:hypothetical protein